MPVDLSSSKAFVHLGATSFDNRETVEGLLPGKALEHYNVILDCPQQSLSVGEASTLPHRGEKIACPYVASSGHPRVEVVIDGGTYGFLIDTGTKLTLVREQLLIDYPEQLLFLEPSNRKEPNDFDTVGLVLDTNSAGQLVVRGVSSSATALTRQNILPGDIIVQISGFGKAPYKLTQAAQALSGHVRERKHLHILSQGKPRSVTVVVLPDTLITTS
jgi:hypothetical protein